MPGERKPDAPVLVVEDDPQVGRLTVSVLKQSGFEAALVASASEGRRALQRERFALAMCDINLPGESGLDLAHHVVRRYPDTAVVMVSGVDDPKIASTALELGAYGYIVKPFTRNELVIGVLNALRRRELELENRRHRQDLETAVQKQTATLWKTIERLKQSEQETRRSQTEAIRRLAAALEFRDATTGTHIERISDLVASLALEAGLAEEQVDLLRLASPLHDVGKIAIPDSVLLKRDALTAAEREIMETHAEIGYRLLSGSEIELLDLAATIAWTHHERLDGTGYPRGLAGDGIPLEGRLVAIADVFDALTSARPYRPAFPVSHALAIMKSERGTHFDPELLDLFLTNVVPHAASCPTA